MKRVRSWTIQVCDCGAEAGMVRDAGDAADHYWAKMEDPDSHDKRSVRVLEAEPVLNALERIAAPKRPDGTYNLSREACEQIASALLEQVGEEG